MTKWEVCDDEKHAKKKWEKKTEEKVDSEEIEPSFDDVFEIYSDFSKVPEERKIRIKETMFLPEPKILSKLNLEWCLRVFPHDQNTSGFFICAIRWIPTLKQTEEFKSKVEEK